MAGCVDRDALVVEHLWLVRHIVRELSLRYPRHVDRTELWNAGALGLVEASRRYDASTGVPFARYASLRIRGAVIDSTRSRDWASRSVRRDLRELSSSEQAFEEQHGRQPVDHELAQVMGMSVAQLSKLRTEAVMSTLLHLDHVQPGVPQLGEEIEEDQAEALPEAALEQKELLGILRTALTYLPPTQLEVMTRYYLNGELLQDIAADFGVSEARVSQIRGEALTAMRACFGRFYEEVPAVDETLVGRRARTAYLSRLADQSTWRSRLAAGDPALELVPETA